MITGYCVLMPLAPWESPESLRCSLLSLANQTIKPQQVLVSCDGRPPDALHHCLICSNLPIHIVLGPGNEGVGPVLARGLEECSYEFVVRADSDDISKPSRCEKQIVALTAMDRVIALSAAIEEFTTTDQTRKIRQVPSTRREILRTSRWRNPLNHPATIFRKSSIFTVGNYRSRAGFEDYDLWLRLLHYFGPDSLGNLEEVLVMARVGQQHLARRHGIVYAKNEFFFLIGCAQDNLLPWGQVAILLMTRIPTRVLPVIVLKLIMSFYRKDV